jgi:hypothetical protein
MANAGEPTAGRTDRRGFEVTMMFHPSHHVTDLTDAEAWFDRVFGRASTPLAAMSRNARPREGYPTDYSTFTPISDVLFDSIDPKRYVLHGVQRYATVHEPHLKAIGWYIDGMAEAYRELRRHGIRVVDQLDDVAEGDDPPTAAGSRMPLFFTVPHDAGLRYEFFPAIPFPLDPRLAEGWTIPPVSAHDPLEIERCASHTILTRSLDRALRFATDALGGLVVHRGRNEMLGADSAFVHVADSILEYAVPDEGTDAETDWARGAPDDTYHSLTWKVRDLAAVERHLVAQDVAIRCRTSDTIVTDPGTSLGMSWGFTTAALTGDPR